MNKFRLTIQMLAIAVFTLAFASMAQAQATRTWVSGVGDDVNPCSRTAPCKTFAGAISKTAAGGEIDCLDPGGFGAVTITKSITIDGTHGAGFGSILHSGVNGVNVNDGATATPGTIKVRLRSLSIQGAGTTPGTRGINFTSGKSVEVIDCLIQGSRSSPGHGIDVSLTQSITGNQRLFVTDTIITDCLGTGIRASNSAGGVNIVLNNVTVQQCGTGISASTNSRWVVKGSSFLSNTGSGVEALAGNVGIDLESCLMQGNGSGLAIAANTTRISDCRITNNTNGINFVGGTLVTYGDNKIEGNTNDTLGGSIPAPINKR